jgi:hypothetical protein
MRLALAWRHLALAWRLHGVPMALAWRFERLASLASFF